MSVCIQFYLGLLKEIRYSPTENWTVKGQQQPQCHMSERKRVERSSVSIWQTIKNRCL